MVENSLVSGRMASSMASVSSEQPMATREQASGEKVSEYAGWTRPLAATWQTESPSHIKLPASAAKGCWHRCMEFQISSERSVVFNDTNLSVNQFRLNSKDNL